MVNRFSLYGNRNTAIDKFKESCGVFFSNCNLINFSFILSFQIYQKDFTIPLSSNNIDPKDEVGGFHVLQSFVGCRKLVFSSFPKGAHKQLIVIF